jgi:TonB family protein
MPNNTRAIEGQRQNCLGDKKQALEVRQTWAGNVLDIRHFRSWDGAVHIGQRLGWRWEFLGVDMGWVSEPWHRVLPWLPPIWSEVRNAVRDDFPVAETALMGADSHTLFTWDALEARWMMRPPGQSAPVPITAQTHRLEVGGQVFEARMVPAPRRVKRSPWAMDLRLGLSGALTGFVGLCFGAVVATAPVGITSTSYEIEDAHFEALLRVQPKPPVKKKVEAIKESPKKVDKGQGPKTKIQKMLERQKGGGPGKRAKDREAVKTMGLFAGGGLDALLGNTGIHSDLRAAVGKLAAKGDGGIGIGVAGLGDRGDWMGQGGGGIDGLGGIDRFGDGGLLGPGGGGGLGDDKSDGILSDSVLPPLVIGSLDAALVDEVIKRNLAQIRYCYQRQLPKDRTLAGKIAIKFVISNDGTVSSARVKSSSLDNAQVEQCVVGRFLRMDFPQPKGGGIVTVSYPFMFSPG